MKFKGYAIVMAVGLSVSAVSAHSAADVHVKGKITPLSSACDITTDARLDYGEIPSASINRNGVTFLETRKLRFRIDCPAPAKTAVRFVDTKSGTAVNDAEFLNEVENKIFPKDSLTQANAFGLGVGADSRKTGAFFMREYRTTYLDGLGGLQNTQLIRLEGGDWQHNEWMPLKHQGVYAPNQFGWVPGEPEHAVALTRQVFMTVDVTPALNTKNLSMKNPINLDGKFACELIYL